MWRGLERGNRKPLRARGGEVPPPPLSPPSPAPTPTPSQSCLCLPFLSSSPCGGLSWPDFPTPPPASWVLGLLPKRTHRVPGWKGVRSHLEQPPRCSKGNRGREGARDCPRAPRGRAKAKCLDFMTTVFTGAQPTSGHAEKGKAI